jgi:hypothetical protein
MQQLISRILLDIAATIRAFGFCVNFIESPQSTESPPLLDSFWAPYVECPVQSEENYFGGNFEHRSYYQAVENFDFLLHYYFDHRSYYQPVENFSWIEASFAKVSFRFAISRSLTSVPSCCSLFDLA